MSLNFAGWRKINCGWWRSEKGGVLHLYPGSEQPFWAYRRQGDRIAGRKRFEGLEQGVEFVNGLEEKDVR
jgi:hypothetical protein